MKKSNANETRSASALISERIAELGAWRGKTLSRMRKLVKEADPDVVEEWKWVKPTKPGTPVWWHGGAPVGTAGSEQVVLIRVPGDGIQPEALVDGRGVLHVLYFTGEPRAGDLLYVRSNDYGQTFSTPIRVNSQPGSAIATGTIRGGQIAIGRS